MNTPTTPESESASTEGTASSGSGAAAAPPPYTGNIVPPLLMPRMLQIARILVPSDFSTRSDQAAEYAARLAKEFKAEIHLLHVPAPETAANEAAPSSHEETRTSAERKLLAVRDQLTATGVAIQVHVCFGEPPAEIIKFAAASAADVIVIGAQGHAGMRDALAEGTAERVIHRAPCPVLVVRDHGCLPP
jgi:nucleotide-binding universal stress UspA family protein